MDYTNNNIEYEDCDDYDYCVIEEDEMFNSNINKSIQPNNQINYNYNTQSQMNNINKPIRNPQPLNNYQQNTLNPYGNQAMGYQQQQLNLNTYKNQPNRHNAPYYNQNNNNQGLVGGYNFNNINEDDSENSEEYSEEEALQECYECTIPGPDGHLCDNPLMGNALDNHYRCSSCNRLHPVRDIAERPVRCLICENNFCT